MKDGYTLGPNFVSSSLQSYQCEAYLLEKPFVMIGLCITSSHTCTMRVFSQESLTSKPALPFISTS